MTTLHSNVLDDRPTLVLVCCCIYTQPCAMLSICSPLPLILIPIPKDASPLAMAFACLPLAITLAAIFEPVFACNTTKSCGSQYLQASHCIFEGAQAAGSQKLQIGQAEYCHWMLDCPEEIAKDMILANSMPPMMAS